MTRLSSEQVLRDNNTSDPDSVSSLKLTYKALSDVSCLGDFKNLERLDLSFNSLTSLEGLKACVQLKWLAVVQNKLESLRGIEGLSKLTVLNAGKNKLKSMDGVGSLLSLRALILNDNEIISICKLNQMTDLNTLVLSRNPIREIGESLVKVKSLTKVSLSNCQLQTIGSSLKSCIELKELRLAHNGVTTLPDELARNKKLQNLDIGNNAILRWSDLKVLTSLVNLKNLNVQGNPVAEKDTLAKKIKSALPDLQIFNAKPIEKYTKNREIVEVDDSSITDTNRLEVLKEDKRELIGKRNSKHLVMDSKDGRLEKGVVVEKKLKHKRHKTNDEVPGEDVVTYDDTLENVEDVDVEKQFKRKREKTSNNAKDIDVEKELKQKRQKSEKIPKKEVPGREEVDGKVKRNQKKMSNMEVGGRLNIIDDPEASFADILAADTAENPKYSDEKKEVGKTVLDKNLLDGLVTFSAKKKKAKGHGTGSTLNLSPTVEIGMGGPSTWGD